MATDKIRPTAHIDTVLPKPPAAAFLNEKQWRVLYSLMDAMLPSIVSKTTQSDRKNVMAVDQTRYDSLYDDIKSAMTNPPSRDAFDAFLSEKVTENQEFRDHMTRALSSVPHDMLKQLSLTLTLLGTRLGSLPLTGHAKPVFDLSISTREEIIKSWQASWLHALRNLAKSLGVLVKKVWCQTSPLFRELSGFADLPENYEAAAPAEYSFMQLEAGAEPAVIETDVVIVGSGCGGGVCAKNLAEAGHRVLVVDKGYYFPPAALPMRSVAADLNLLENGGVVSSDDGSMNVLAGSCWGGGGSINWGVSLRTPEYVRKEWAEKRGLPFFMSRQFEECMERVCGVMGVSESMVRHNHRGQVLLDGAKKLGWDAKTTPHNSGNKDHYCGHCHLGCGSAGKQGPAVCWLPAAARAGAQFMEGFQVERVTFDTFAAGKKATGIVGRWTSRDRDGALSGSLDQRITRDVVIKARKVIISCGTLWSPVVLKKSGLANPHIGRNLYLHPVNVVIGRWKEETKPWEGCAISSVLTTFENLDNEGHGPKIEPTCMVPSTIFPSIPWRNGLDMKLTAMKYRHMDAFIILTRDRDTGHVYPDPHTGKPRISYSPSAFDRASALEGVIAMSRICYAMGAVEVRPCLSVRSFLREKAGDSSEKRDAAFTEWLEEVRTVGNPPTAPWACAHQMGTCRMGRSQDEGVVDSKGKVWGIENLYVADASVLPSASGVNPMITNMAIADWISTGLVADMKK